MTPEEELEVLEKEVKLKKVSIEYDALNEKIHAEGGTEEEMKKFRDLANKVVELRSATRLGREAVEVTEE